MPSPTKSLFKFRPRLTEEEYQLIVAHRAAEEAMPEIPSSWEETPNKTINIECETLGVLSDIHVPFHDEAALSKALTWMKSEGVKKVLINGDFADCYAISHWETKSHIRNYQKEMEMAADLYKRICDYINVPVYFRVGNHEERYDRYRVKAEYMEQDIPPLNAKIGVPEPLYLGERKPLKFGKLRILHGHELGTGGGVNVSRNVLLRTMSNTLFGHFHKTQEHTHMNIDRQPIAAWAVGCLCQLNMQYMVINQWNHGAAIVRMKDSEGNFEVFNKIILV